MIFCTSRGKQLDEYLNKQLDAVVFFRKGGKIDQISEQALEKIPKYLRKYKVVHVYFLIGIPDIAKRMKRDSYQEVTFDTKNPVLVEEINNKLLVLTNKVKQLGCGVCFCTIAPMHLETWNEHRLTEEATDHLEFRYDYHEM